MTCPSGKNCHKTHGGAYREWLRMRNVYGVHDLAIYKCRKCGSYHIGNPWRGAYKRLIDLLSAGS